MDKKIIHMNEKFVDDGTAYEVCQYQDLYDICTYVYDDEDNCIFGTKDVDDFTKFYRLGWTKEEVHAGIKESWIIAKDVEDHLDDLESCAPYDAVEWLNLGTWEKLPTEDAFVAWLRDDFEPIWDELKEKSEESIFEEDNAQLIASVERLDKAMEKDPELVQVIG